jgi:alpha-amylase
MNAYLSPYRGGSLFEWDHRPTGYNLLNTLTRREEQYHENVHKARVMAEEEVESASIHDLLLAKEPDLHHRLHFDRWTRAALLDHFHGWNSTIEEFRDGKLADYGTFLDQPYSLHELFTDGLTLIRTGHVGEVQVEIQKTIRAVPGKPTLHVDYRVRNQSHHELHSPFGIEWNLALMSGESPTHHISIPEVGEWNRPLNETRAYDSVQEIRLLDERESVAVRFSFDGGTGLWRAPVESISNSEGGFERVFQSIALLFRWDLHLGPDQVWHRRITANLSTA